MPVIEYPYDGCCEHTHNAHTRDHCMLCTCVRGPIQVGPTVGTVAPLPAQPAVLDLVSTPEVDPDLAANYSLLILIDGALGVLCCKTCGALVGDPALHTTTHPGGTS
jgi:hypothetical protein